MGGLGRKALAAGLATIALVGLIVASAFSTTQPQTSRRAASQAARPSAARPVTRSQAALLASGNLTFAGRVLRLLAQTHPSLALSPFSISQDIALVDAGARGTTASQIAHALDFTLPVTPLAAAFGALNASLAKVNQPGATLRTANALYGQQGARFNHGFLTTLASGYGAPLRTVDFTGNPSGALTEINGWVSQETDGKIPNLLSEQDVDTSPPPRLVLVNAVYLDAKWQEPFMAADTESDTFAAPSGSVSVPTMHEDGTFAYASHGGERTLELPYVGGRLALDLVLPNPGQLPAVKAGLGSGGIAAALKGLHSERVGLSLPKFTMDTRFELQGALSSLGMPIAFSGAANFTGIGPGGLAISSVVHEAYIDVDEAGTEAAAATGTVVAPTAAIEPPPLTFDVNRPFLFFLRDRRTGAVLFEGLVSDP